MATIARDSKTKMDILLFLEVILKSLDSLARGPSLQKYSLARGPSLQKYSLARGPSLQNIALRGDPLS